MSRTPEMTRIPSLDGVRAIAIAMVCVSHVTQSVGAPTHHFSSFGNLGVRIFFALSGFLITKLLLRELELTGQISLGDFYLRRTLRIFPAFYCFAAVVLACHALGVIALLPGDVTHMLTYTVNYHQQRTWFIGHLWSLSVEEQFYLVWPLTLMLGGVRAGLWAAFGAVLVAPVVRVLALPHVPHLAIMEWFPTTFDALATGSILAILRERPGINRWLSRFTGNWLVYLLGVLVVAINSLQWHVPVNRVVWFEAFGLTLMNVGIAICLERAIRHPEDLAGKLLNSRPIVFVGAISYSLYLWQQPFLSSAAGAPSIAFPANILLALGVAIFSYYLIETPVLSLRKRLSSKSGLVKRAAPLVAAASTSISEAR
jgi:peptidoglycan/LPS O-acetylase OafA/YrhL